MEKRGVIAPGVTPSEDPPEHTKESQHVPAQTPAVAVLDNDFRKRAAEAARTATN
jgi:hypothetical protein